MWVVSSINTNKKYSSDYYELRVWNITENKLIATNKFNNVYDNICKLNIINQPTKDSYLELQAKTENGIKISVKNVTLLF